MLSDPNFFSRAYRAHRQRALAIANRVLRDPAAAEDVVQDVFMQLWSQPASYDPRRGSVATYVAMMTRSRAVDRWRTRAAGEAALERAAAEHGRGPEAGESSIEPTARRDERRQTLRALAELPAEQRDAILLSYGRGLTAREIARATGIPLGTAKSRLRLGLAAARGTLEAAA